MRSDVKEFDRKFGARFLSSVPSSAGVYFFYNDRQELVYVGKAKNLRARLRQYRNISRLKKDRKKKKIIKQASAISWESSPSELEASLLEIRLIQQHRPRLNVSGAFSFLYPMIGIFHDDKLFFVCLTTRSGLFSEFDFYGAFRSREITGNAFFSWVHLLQFVGHAVSHREIARRWRVPHSYVFGYRQLPSGWPADWASFFRGEEKRALEELSLSLLDNAGARAKATEIEEHLEALNLFWAQEATVLAEAIKQTGYVAYPVTQTERDPLFLNFRNLRQA